MAVNLSFCPRAARMDISKKARAAQNFCHLFRELPFAEQNLLCNLDAQVVFTRDSKREAGVDVETAVINFSLQQFSGFNYKRGKPGAAQIDSFETLREEALHYFDLFSGFSASEEWRQTAWDEIRNPSALSRTLMTNFRRNTNSKNSIKCDIREYKEDEQPPELLAEILLIKRRLLVSSHDDESSVEARLQAAFPRNYQMAKKFEIMIGEEASRGAPTDYRDKPFERMRTPDQWRHLIKTQKLSFVGQLTP